MYDGTLSPADLARIAEVREDWMRVALSTERCDRAAAEAAVRLVYETAGLPAPPVVVWMDSPLGGALAAAAVKRLGSGGQLRGQLGDQLWDHLRGQLWDHLGDQLWDHLWDHLWDQLGGHLWDQLGDQLRDQLRGQLWDHLRDQLWDHLRGQLGDHLRGQLGDHLRGQLGDQLRDQLRDQLYRSIDPWSDAYWLAYLTCALPLAELESPRLDALVALQREVGWWWPMQGAVVLTDRPTVLSRDPLGELHCETGPALAYADGYALHTWHGTPVPADLIESEWGADRILREPNAEVRRCAIEKRGWDWFVDAAGLQQVGSSAADPGNPGHELALYDLPERIFDEPVRVLLCANATPERDGQRRRFGLTVPGSISDPVAAAAWTFGVNPSDYRALQRAT